MDRMNNYKSPESRRLRPIYDNIDNGNNRGALQLADKLLKKQKDFLCAKALKALALLRLGKQKESLALTKEVADRVPVDEPTLQALSMCFRELHTPRLVVELYQNVVKKVPQNEEYQTHLFMAFVRLEDFKRQQQVAMALYKIHPKNPYYFWAVMSIVMQAIKSPDRDLAAKMLLPLALKMVEKFVQEDKIEAEAEVNLYLLITDLLGKHQQALDLLQGKFGELVHTYGNHKQLIIAELCKKLQRCAQLNSIYKQLLLKESDHWDFYKEYFASAFALIEAGSTPSDESQEEGGLELGADRTVESVVGFIEERIQQNQGLRGPLLARIELLKQLQARNLDVANQIAEPCLLLKQYFEMFGSKPCCFHDLQPYCTLLLGQEQRQPFIDSIALLANLHTPPTSVKGLQQQLAVFELSRGLGLQDWGLLGQAGHQALLGDLLDRYRTGRLLGGAQPQPSDLLPSDNFCLMAVHLLLDSWQHTGMDSSVWRAIGLLENGLKSSPHSHHFKLLLLRLYTQMGVFSPCASLYDDLEIKHVQQDSLGYMVVRYCQSLGHFESANSLYNATLKFYTGSQRETIEYVMSAYKYGSFNKIPEFSQFREAIEYSYHFAAVTVEKMLLDLLLEANSSHSFEDMIHSMEIIPDQDEIAWDKLQDNRDFDLWACWDPAGRLVQEDRRCSFDQEKCWLQIRSLTLRCLAAAAAATTTTPSQTGGQREHPHPEASGQREAEAGAEPGLLVGRLAEELRTLLAQLRQYYQHWDTQKFGVGRPPESRAVQYLSQNHGEVLANMAAATGALSALHRQQSGDCQDAVLKIKGLQSQVAEGLRAGIEPCRGGLLIEGGQKGRRHLDKDLLPRLVLLTENSCFVLMMAGVCHKILVPIKAAASMRKSKKKMAVNTTILPVFEDFAVFLKQLGKCLDDLHLVVLECEPAFINLKLATLNLDQDVASNSHNSDLIEEEKQIMKEVWEKVEMSYQESSRNLSVVLKKQLDFIATLVL